MSIMWIYEEAVKIAKDNLLKTENMIQKGSYTDRNGREHLKSDKKELCSAKKILKYAKEEFK